MVDAYAHPTGVPSQIIDAVGNRLSVLGDEEVVNSHRFGVLLRPPLFSRVFEVTHQLLFLCIHGNHRLTIALEATNLPIDMSKLLIAVRMVRPLARFLVCLKAIACGRQELRNQLIADSMPHDL